MGSEIRLSRRTLAASALIAAPALKLTSTFAQSSPEASPESGTRIVTDVYGEVEVPANPQRVVVLDGPQLDACLAVGVIPVGAVTVQDGAAFPEYLGDQTNGIENIGTISEPNLEMIINLQPDLILGSIMRNEEIHGTLTEIAPTVFSDQVSDDWHGNFMLFTNAVNKSKEADEVVAAYQARLDEFKAATDGERDAWSISVVRFRTDNVRIYRDTSFVGTILNGAGLNRPESQTGPDPDRGIFTVISMEQVNLADGTHIFTCTYGDPAETTAPDFTSSSLWQSLEAVQNNKVYWVNDDFWMVAVGYLAADKVVDDLFTYLVDGQPGESIPL